MQEHPVACPSVLTSFLSPSVAELAPRRRFFFLTSVSAGDNTSNGRTEMCTIETGG